MSDPQSEKDVGMQTGKTERGIAERERHDARAKDERFTPEKCREMFLLLIEARDALPAISLASAKLRGLDLTLADRIEKCLEPWKVPDGTPGAL